MCCRDGVTISCDRCQEVPVKSTARGEDGKMARSISRQARAKREEKVSETCNPHCSAVCVVASIGRCVRNILGSMNGLQVKTEVQSSLKRLP